MQTEINWIGNVVLKRLQEAANAQSAQKTRSLTNMRVHVSVRVLVYLCAGDAIGMWRRDNNKCL